MHNSATLVTNDSADGRGEDWKRKGKKGTMKTRKRRCRARISRKNFARSHLIVVTASIRKSLPEIRLSAFFGWKLSRLCEPGPCKTIVDMCTYTGVHAVIGNIGQDFQRNFVYRIEGKFALTRTPGKRMSASTLHSRLREFHDEHTQTKPLGMRVNSGGKIWSF